MFRRCVNVGGLLLYGDGLRHGCGRLRCGGLRCLRGLCSLALRRFLCGALRSGTLCLRLSGLGTRAPGACSGRRGGRARRRLGLANLVRARVLNARDIRVLAGRGAVLAGIEGLIARAIENTEKIQVRWYEN